MARLATNVHVTDEQGTSHVFGPADVVPTWAEALITNPKAWAEAPEPTSSVSRLADPAPSKAPVKRAARRKAAADDTVHGD